jgi:hypothetical protein
MTMAVETNKGGNGQAPSAGATLTGVPAPTAGATLTGIPAQGSSPGQTLTGMAAAAAAAGKNKRKRPSSLMAIQSSLPSVENSLDDFIARANETLVDAEKWQAEKAAQQEQDDQRKEADQLRWKAAEQQLREGEAREHSLRRQLDGLQGRLADAEARAAVSGSNEDGVIADLKIQLQKMNEKLRQTDTQAQQAQARAEQLTVELATAKHSAAQIAPPPARDSLPDYEAEELQERVRIAEAKANKALAAAKAASAGLTVNPADIAAIESGLVVPQNDQPKGTNWALVIGALVIGAGAMFAIAKFAMKSDSQPAQPAAQVQPAAAPTAPAAPSKPTVTPIEEPAAAPSNAAAPAPTNDQAAPANTAAAPTAPAAPDNSAALKAAAEKAAAEQAAADKAAAEKAAAEKAAAEKAAAEQAAKTPPKHAAPVPKHQAAPAAHPAGGIADPFGGGGDAPKKAAPKTSGKKAGGGGIVDPF